MTTQVVEYHAPVLGVPMTMDDVSSFSRCDLAIQDVVQPHGLVAERYFLVNTGGWSARKVNDFS